MMMMVPEVGTGFMNLVLMSFPSSDDGGIIYSI